MKHKRTGGEQSPAEIRKKWMTVAAVLILIGAAVLVLLSLRSPCIVRESMGIPCPGCGMTRAALSFLRGDFAEVNRWHPMFWGLFPLFGYLIACIFFRKLRKWVWIPILVFGIAMVLCWIIRMALFFPGEPPMDLNPSSWMF
ncbi:MAG: DUF2752 domain-containing protein [Clostridiales bacterium]|nr:DUF2752 domain-containing protein [Clostridiales bacterium]